jgi:NADPH oxidase 2
MPLIPQTTPFIGGKSVVELLICLGWFGLTGGTMATLDPTNIGRMSDYLGAFMILFALRKVSILSILGVSFERGLFWHKILAVCMMTTMFVHAVGKGANGSGFVIVFLTCVGICAYSLSYWSISFNSFYYVHMLCYAIAAPVLLGHGGTFFGLAGLFWLADLAVRYLISGHKSIAKIVRFTEDIVRVEIPNPFKSQEAGQYCFLMFPEINMYEFHPFSVASAPGDDNLVFYIKTLGDWTQKLQSLSDFKVKVEGGESDMQEIRVHVEGPYGHLAVDVFNGNAYPVRGMH